jgi:L-threonylcarbamoyladenylate synthase
LVVPRAAHVPSIVAGGGDSIAVRAPAHPVARALILALGEPIAAPSANRYQTLSPTRAEHVVKSLGDRVELVLDGGACESGIESTVVDVRGARARVLRPGALSIGALRAVEADIEVAAGIVAEGADRASPGMDARHYAPRARAIVVPTRAGAVDAAISRSAGGSVGLVVRGVVEVPLPAGVALHVLPDSPEPYAAALFATLHALDDEGVAAIVIEAVPEGEAWWAVADRLHRAAT